MKITELNQLLGNLDLYLLDQVLKGRFEGKQRILDAGCGEGRNLTWFLREGYDVYGFDANEDAIRMLQFVARSLRPHYDLHRFYVEQLEQALLTPAYFDVVICSAVLHFARDHQHFKAMLQPLLRTLKPDGVLFIRMCSDIGLGRDVVAGSAGLADLPDGSTRYLLTREMLREVIHSHSLALLEPVKTVNVQDQRAMTTLVLTKADVTASALH